MSQSFSSRSSMFLPVTLKTPNAATSYGSVSVILNCIKLRGFMFNPILDDLHDKATNACASFSTGFGPEILPQISIKKGWRGQFLNWHKSSRFPFHFIKKYNCPLTSNRVSYIIWSFHIVELAEFSTFPQHPCGKPEDGRAMRPNRSVACAWALLIPHTYYRRIRCICQACVEINIKLKVYCLRAPDAHILRSGLRAPMHIACG